jgi:8-oxo-dGTP pyrophosphatase MutT (NUDIX family)
MLPEFNSWFLKRLLETADLPVIPKDETFDHTSVFLLIFIKNNFPFILAILKSDTPGYPWRNQVALPGGHVDKTDPTPLETAYRELKEEIGISKDQVELIGSMGHFQTIGHKDIEVFMGVWNCYRDTISFDSKEISKILEIPIESLLKKHLSSRFCGHIPGIDKLLYPFEEVVVWGVTARIFHYFIELLLKNLDETTLFRLQNNT